MILKMIPLYHTVFPSYNCIHLVPNLSYWYLILCFYGHCLPFYYFHILQLSKDIHSEVQSQNSMLDGMVRLGSLLVYDCSQQKLSTKHRISYILLFKLIPLLLLLLLLLLRPPRRTTAVTCDNRAIPSAVLQICLKIRSERLAIWFLPVILCIWLIWYSSLS